MSEALPDEVVEVCRLCNVEGGTHHRECPLTDDRPMTASIRKPPDWVGTPEVQRLLATTLASELRTQASSLRAMIESVADEHRRGLMAAAGRLELRAAELERGNR